MTLDGVIVVVKFTIVVIAYVGDAVHFLGVIFKLNSYLSFLYVVIVFNMHQH